MTPPDDVSERIEKSLSETLAGSHKKIERGLVWCRTCGRQKAVDPAKCIREGWPMCCGHTMTIDAPEERIR